MIIGIGSDLIDIRRVAKVMTWHEARFIKRCFTTAEKEKAERRRGAGTHIDTYAKRFAAKEACSKALGTGFGQGVFMKDMGVVNLPSGKPTMELTGGAKKRLDELTPDGHRAVIHLTITDEPPIAEAFVFIEAVKL